MNKALFSSKDMCWCTPPDFFEKLNNEFNFNLDAAATDKSAKCEDYFTPEDDGLSKDWGGALCLHQSTIRPSNSGLGAQGIRRKPKTRHSYCNAHTLTN